MSRVLDWIIGIAQDICGMKRPKIGERWVWIGSGDPFCEAAHPVTVHDIKGGYVQYQTHYGCLRSHNMIVFRDQYKRVG